MTSRTRLLVLLISAPIIAFAVIGGFLGRAIAHEETYEHLQVFQDVVGLVIRNYVENVNSDRIMRGAMRGLAESLDADSAFLPQDQARTYQQDAKQPAADVGLTLTRQYYLRVVAARDNSPAARAGLRPGDFVRMIDNKPTREMSVYEGSRLLRGAAGSKVALTVIRSTVTDPHQVELTREAVPAPVVNARMQQPGVGYVRITGFSPRTPAELQAKIDDLHKQGAARLLIDVRNCADGALTDGVAAARLFVPSGTLAVRETRDKPREPITAAAGDGGITLPVIVLVNVGTSGPAELFAAALRGNKRAELVGEKTLGRVTQQKFVPLPDGSALLLSNSWFLTPAAEQIQDKGLTPNVEVEEPDVEFGTPPPSIDPLLLKAIERVNGKSAG
ncbi:MAG: S41 family peptidase [Bacteroidales bacterium]